MSTYIRLNQIRKADLFDDTLTVAQIQGIESSAVDHEDFLGGMLSQINRIIGETNWFDPVQDGTADPRNLKTITDDVYFKTLLRRRSILTDVSVPALQNWVVLSAAGSETPSETAAVDAGSASGAVCATLAGDVGSHSLNEVAGINAISPKDLLVIRDATTFDPILSSGREVYGLLQAESGVVDGDSFNDTDHQAQISFVRQNAAGDDLEACPVADIAGLTINYAYVSRVRFNVLNEQDFLFGTFSDPQSASATTLNQAYIAGNTITVQTAEGDLTFNLSEDTTDFLIQRNGGAFGTFTRDDTTGDLVQFDTDKFFVNTTQDAEFNDGAAFDTGGTQINVGSTAGQIDASGITLRGTTGDVTMYSDSGNVLYRDTRETTALPFTDATAGAISALPGGPYSSISAAIRAAITSADLDIFIQVLASNYAQDANIPGGWSPALDLSARSIDMNTPSGVDTVIMLNGRMLYGGNGTTNNDVYAGDTPANGDIKVDFPKGVKSGDVFIALSWKSG